MPCQYSSPGHQQIKYWLKYNLDDFWCMYVAGNTVILHDYWILFLECLFLVNNSASQGLRGILHICTFLGNSRHDVYKINIMSAVGPMTMEPGHLQTWWWHRLARLVVTLLLEKEVSLQYIDPIFITIPHFHLESWWSLKSYILNEHSHVIKHVLFPRNLL